MKEKFISIRWYIMGMFLLLIFFIFICVTFLMVKTQKQNMIREIELRGTTIAQNIANNVADLLLIKYDLEVAKILKETTKDKSIIYALVVDKDNKILAHNDMQFVGANFLPCCFKFYLSVNKTPVYFDKNTGGYIDFSSIAKAKGKINIGTVHIGISYSIIEETIKKTYFNIIIITLIAVVLSIIGSFFISATLTEPIKKLVEGIKKIGEGDLEYKIYVKEKNEIGVLAFHFNKMTESLRQAREKELKQIAIKKELEIARKIQEAILPGNFPGIKNYRLISFYKPSIEIGGDYFDIIQVGDDKFVILISDIAGKGIPAALMMMMFSGIFKIKVNENFNPQTLICNLNNEIISRFSENVFITAFYGVLDTKQNKINMVFAGHNEMLFCSVKGDVRSIFSKGVAIGIVDNEILQKQTEEITLNIDIGDKLLLFTDGLIDAKNKQNERFEMKRLYDILKISYAKSGDEIMNKIKFAINEFMEDTEQEDDIAMLLIERIK